LFLPDLFAVDLLGFLGLLVRPFRGRPGLLVRSRMLRRSGMWRGGMGFRPGSGPCLWRRTAFCVRFRRRVSFWPRSRCWPGFRPALGSGLRMNRLIWFLPCSRPRFWPYLGFGFRPRDGRWLWPRLRPGFRMRLVRNAGTPGFPVDNDRADRRRWTDTLIRYERLRFYERGRPTVIDCRKLSPVGSRSPGQFNLSPHWRGVRSAECRDFSRSWPHANALRAAVVADAVLNDRTVDDDIALVDIGDVDAADVVDGAVVGELIAVPIASLIADADIAKAVVDPAVEADIAAPVSAMETVAIVDESPVSRCPKRALIGRCAPRSGNPVVAGRRIAPIAGGPEIAGVRDGRLLVFRQRRWRLWRVVVRGVVVAGIAVIGGRCSAVRRGTRGGCWRGSGIGRRNGCEIGVGRVAGIGWILALVGRCCGLILAGRGGLGSLVRARVLIALAARHA